MKQFVNNVIDVAMAMGAQYADVRVINQRTEDIRVKNRVLEDISTGESLGWGVRVIVDGAWGFASSFRVEKDAIDGVVKQAVNIAQASARVRRKPVRLAPAEQVVDTFKSPCRVDPFSVGLDEKVNLLMAASEGMMVSEEIKVAEASLTFLQQDKTFANSEGSLIEQTFVESGGGLTCFAVGHGDMQRRTFPNTIWGDIATRGWEHIGDLRLVEEAPRIGEEAVKLLTAKPCPTGHTTIVIEPSQMALQVHESVGHPTELDRILRHEADYAGTSFVDVGMIGNYRYGADIVNITADATVEGARGSFGYDDEGVPGQRVDLIKDGILVGVTSSRETAAEIGATSSGAARADRWNRVPIVRMTNINLEPGDSSLEEMIAGTSEGLYLISNKSWSIDDRRLNFLFGTELAYEIKDGKLGDMVKNATYTGMTPEFWANCDAIGNRDQWRVFGYPCGKGQPGQNGHVGHGVPPARFRNVQVGVMK